MTASHRVLGDASTDDRLERRQTHDFLATLAMQARGGMPAISA
jgi:hypothetical protein